MGGPKIRGGKGTRALREDSKKPLFVKIGLQIKAVDVPQTDRRTDRRTFLHLGLVDKAQQLRRWELDFSRTRSIPTVQYCGASGAPPQTLGLELCLFRFARFSVCRIVDICNIRIFRLLGLHEVEILLHFLRFSQCNYR